MRKLLFILSLSALSTLANAQYIDRNPYAVRPVLGIYGGQGKLTLKQTLFEEDAEEGWEELKLSNSSRENWTAFALGLDFINQPFEVELRYGRIGAGPSDDVQFFEEDIFTGEEVLVEHYRLSQDYDLTALSLTGKLDLSWHCGAGCVYLLAGYNYGELRWKFRIDELIDEDFSFRESKTFRDGFFHYGIGARYAFGAVRLSAEYTRYNVGKMGAIRIWEDAEDEIAFDLGRMNLWQAGIAYMF